jgi:hypothetical protein
MGKFIDFRAFLGWELGYGRPLSDAEFAQYAEIRLRHLCNRQAQLQKHKAAEDVPALSQQLNHQQQQQAKP